MPIASAGLVRRMGLWINLGRNWRYRNKALSSSKELYKTIDAKHGPDIFYDIHTIDSITALYDMRMGAVHTKNRSVNGSRFDDTIYAGSCNLLQT